MNRIWLAMQGSAIALLFFAVVVLFGYLIAPAPSLAQVCAKTNERGSSEWVACVDRKVRERRP